MHHRLHRRQTRTVSIPFKRDGVSELREWWPLNDDDAFLFPSNGTAFLNANYPKWIVANARKSGFYSLQPGRRF